jgi:hypothetical protein
MMNDFVVLDRFPKNFHDFSNLRKQIGGQVLPFAFSFMPAILLTRE